MNTRSNVLFLLLNWYLITRRKLLLMKLLFTVSELDIETFFIRALETRNIGNLVLIKPIPIEPSTSSYPKFVHVMYVHAHFHHPNPTFSTQEPPTSPPSTHELPTPQSDYPPTPHHHHLLLLEEQAQKPNPPHPQASVPVAVSRRYATASRCPMRCGRSVVWTRRC